MDESIGPPAFEQLQGVMRARHSCRAFLPQAVDETLIRRILDTAQATPSWCNTQPWGLHVTLPAATQRLREALAAQGPAQDLGETDGYDIAPPEAYEGVFRDRRRACGFQLYESVGIARDDRAAAGRQAAENFAFFGAPHLALVTTERKLGAYGLLDCGAYVHAFMLAATSLGLHCIAQAALASRSSFFRRELALPEHRQVVCGIAFGYGDTQAPVNRFRTAREPVDRVAQWVRD